MRPKKNTYELVRRAIEHYPNCTTKEIAQILIKRDLAKGKAPIEESTVVGQVTFLKDDRLVVEVGQRKCKHTGHTANILQVVSETNKHLLPPLENKRDKKAQKLFAQIIQDKNISQEVKLKLLNRLQAKILIYGEPKWADLFEEDL